MSWRKYAVALLFLVLLGLSLFRSTIRLNGLPAEKLFIATLVVLTMITALFLYKRWARWFANEGPPQNQAWLMDLRVQYHPTRLEADIQIPFDTEVSTSIQSSEGEELRSWDAEKLETGNFTLERTLEGLDSGRYQFRIKTPEQSTARSFELK